LGLGQTDDRTNLEFDEPLLSQVSSVFLSSPNFSILFFQIGTDFIQIRLFTGSLSG